MPKMLPIGLVWNESVRLAGALRLHCMDVSVALMMNRSNKAKSPAKPTKNNVCGDAGCGLRNMVIPRCQQRCISTINRPMSVLAILGIRADCPLLALFC